MTIIHKVRSLDSFRYGDGMIYTISCPVECDRDKPNLGESICIDGRYHQIDGIERTMIRTPIKQGEMIGIYVKIKPVWHAVHEEKMVLVKDATYIGEVEKVAGKFEAKNIRYVDSFDTFEEAVKKVESFL